MSAPLRVLLVGGTGFMGARSAAALAAAGHDVTVLSRGERAAVPGTSALVADRGDPTALAAALEHRQFDFTVDFVAYDAPDVEHLLTLPYAALGRYVMISTGQVYLVTTTAKPPYREENSEAPLMAEPEAGSAEHANWTYGVGKRRAERALLALRSSHGVRAAILRLPIVQGEADSSLRLWAYLERMLDGGPLLLPDGGVRPTRYVYAGDVARAIVKLAAEGAPRDPILNLSQPDVIPMREFLARVAACAGLTPTFVDVPAAEIEAAGIDRWFSPYGGRWSSVLDPSRAAAWGLGGTRVDDYLPAVVRWHLEHRPARSHDGYAQRPYELALAARLGVGTR